MTVIFSSPSQPHRCDQACSAHTVKKWRRPSPSPQGGRVWSTVLTDPELVFSLDQWPSTTAVAWPRVGRPVSEGWSGRMSPDTQAWSGLWCSRAGQAWQRCLMGHHRGITPAEGRRPGGLSAWRRLGPLARRRSKAWQAGRCTGWAREHKQVLLLCQSRRASRPGGKRRASGHFFPCLLFFCEGQTQSATYHPRRRRSGASLRSRAGPARASGSSMSASLPDMARWKGHVKSEHILRPHI